MPLDKIVSDYNFRHKGFFFLLFGLDVNVNVIWRFLPPGVGLHHHLHEQSEQRQRKDAVSGVQDAAMRPAGDQTTSTHRDQVHADDIWRREKRDMKQDPCQYHTRSLTHTRNNARPLNTDRFIPCPINVAKQPLV